MANTLGFGTMRRPTGWIAWTRLYHHGENRILRHKGSDILFPTEAAAEAAAKKEFLSQMNSTIVSEALTGPTTKKALARAELKKLFRNGKEIQVERAG